MQFSQINTRRRLLAIGMLVAFVFCVLFSRLAYIQLVWNTELQARAMDQWTRDVPLVAPRGRIVDINGITLADTSTSYTLYVRPNAVTDANAVTKTVCDVLGLGFDSVYAKVTRRGVSEVLIRKKITHSEMYAIKSSGCSGLYFSEDIARFYPYGNFLTQILGFCDYDTLGQSGLEKYYDEYLRGVNGKILTEADLVGRGLGKDTLYYLPAQTGADVKLTIDYYIQALAEKAVNDAQQTFNSKSASCIVINPTNGAIYAIAEAPTYDLNDLPRDNLEYLFDGSRSSIVSEVFEPGSTFKILTTAIGVEEGIIGDSTRVFCPGYRMIDGQRIRCWRTIGHGSQTVAEGVSNSCNCLFMDTAVGAGVDTMYEYFYRFGLNRVTGIDINGEASGLLIRQEHAKRVDIARMGFGQAIAMTPLELLTAVCAVINGGTTVSPHLVDSIYSADGRQIFSYQTAAGERIISQNTSHIVREYLQGVVSNGGGKKAGVAGYSIGGKTGTAQKYENGRIAQGKYVSSFVGFTSVENPQYAVLFIVDEPSGYLYYGSLVAAPYVGDIFRGIFAYKGMEPTHTATPEYVSVPSLYDMTAESAIDILKSAGLLCETEGEGRVVYQFPEYGTAVMKGETVFIKLAPV